MNHIRGLQKDKSQKKFFRKYNMVLDDWQIKEHNTVDVQVSQKIWYLLTCLLYTSVPQCTLPEQTPQVEHDRLGNLLLFCQTIVLHFSFDVPVAMLATVLSTSSLGRCWVVIGYPVSPRVRVESLRTLFLEQEQFHGRLSSYCLSVLRISLQFSRKQCVVFCYCSVLHLSLIHI